MQMHITPRSTQISKRLYIGMKWEYDYMLQYIFQEDIINLEITYYLYEELISEE